MILSQLWVCFDGKASATSNFPFQPDWIRMQMVKSIVFQIFCKSFKMTVFTLEFIPSETMTFSRDLHAPSLFSQKQFLLTSLFPLPWKICTWAYDFCVLSTLHLSRFKKTFLFGVLKTSTSFWASLSCSSISLSIWHLHRREVCSAATNNWFRSLILRLNSAALRVKFCTSETSLLHCFL